MSDRTFVCCGPCWKCGLGCAERDQQKVPPAPMPPLHEGCSCYVNEHEETEQ